MRQFHSTLWALQWFHTSLPHVRHNVSSTLPNSIYSPEQIFVILCVNFVEKIGPNIPMTIKENPDHKRVLTNNH